MSLPDLTISVIIPLLNGAALITQALDSVFKQSVAPIEVIVVDDGSTDGGPEIVTKYIRNRPIVLLRNPNAGRAATLNHGVRQSSGRLIALLDQTDTWHPNHLHELSRPFAEADGETVGWTYSNVDEIAADGSLRIRSRLSERSAEHPKRRVEKCLSDDMMILPSASMIARSAFDAVGGFDEHVCGYEIDDLFLRLFLAKYRNVYVDQPLTQCRLSAGESSDGPSRAPRHMLYARKLLALFPDEPGQSPSYARDIIAPRFLRPVANLTRAALRQGNLAEAEAGFRDISFLESHISAVPKPYPLRDDLFITAVIPLYNGGRFIREAISSVFDQTLLPDEVIVVDDGSTDDGPAIVRELSGQYPIKLIHKPNGGQSSARNLGVEHAHGDLIAFLDQDDVWYPNHLAKLVKPFLRRRMVEVGWTYSDLDEINEEGELIARGIAVQTRAEHPKRSLTGCLRHDMFVLPSASLISRRAFLQVGGFDERLSGYEDDDLFLRLFLAGFDNIFLPDSLSKWRVSGFSCSYSPRMAISRAFYARKLMLRFPNDINMDRYLVRDVIAPRFFRLLTVELRRATRSGTREQQLSTLASLRFVTAHLPAKQRIPLQVIGLPALRIPPVARFLMNHATALASIHRRIFGS
jgi:glycosyltransferase involved in cell wall biosynthesis